MKQFHRTTHRLMWTILGPVTIALLIAALASRPAKPIQPTPTTAPPPRTSEATP